MKVYHKEYYLKNKEKIIERSHQWNINNKAKIAISRKKSRMLRLNSWCAFFPQESNCEICGKKIFFKGHRRRETIHFDHKYENCVIKINPSRWIDCRYATKENRKIFASCNFGLLCSPCNKGLPTKNRKEWLKKVEKYVSKN